VTGVNRNDNEGTTVKPYTGARVLYKLHAGDVEQINRRRRDFEVFNRVHSPADHEPGSFPGRSGHIGHFGNEVAEDDVYPADVVRIFDPQSTTVNLQVHLDGNDTYWATSRSQGTEAGQWSWPAQPQHEPGDRPPRY
jgi:hypothetical protein